MGGVDSWRGRDVLLYPSGSGKRYIMNRTGVDILLADDGPDDAMLCVRALIKSGFANRVCHVKDGAMALDYIYCREAYSDRCKDENPKLILLDLKMPKISGIQVLGILKADS